MIAFALAALVLVVIPGPDQALITRNVLSGGRRAGLLTMAGGVLGVSVHATAAALGLAALLLASEMAFTVLKFAGVAYLLWLAVQTLRAAFTKPPVAPSSEDAAEPRRPVGAYLRQGFLSNALNPKVALFFVTFLPQFLTTGGSSPQTEGLLLSGVFTVLYISWFSLYVLAADQLARRLRSPRVKAWIERVTGVIFLAVAVQLATTAVST